MNNISSLTEQTITLVPSAEFCIPVLSFVLCLLHCTVPALFLSGQICSFPQLPVSGNQGRCEEEGKHIFYGNAQTHQTTHRQVREHGAQCTIYQEKWHFLLWLFCILASALPTWCRWWDFFAIWIHLKLCEHLFVSFMLMIIWSFLPSRVWSYTVFEFVFYCWLLPEFSSSSGRLTMSVTYGIEGPINHATVHGGLRSGCSLSRYNSTSGELIFPILGPILDLSQQKNSANIGWCTFTHFDNTFVGETSPIAIRVISSTNQLALGYI